MTLRRFAGLGALLSLISPGIALAQNATLDSGGTAWLLTATALVLFTGYLSSQKSGSVGPVPGSHCERGYSL